MTNDEFRKHSEAIVDAAVSTLMGHFDAVQVMVTRQDGDVSMYCGRGKGNYYARLGMIHAWLESPTVSDDEPDEDE